MNQVIIRSEEGRSFSVEYFLVETENLYGVSVQLLDDCGEIDCATIKNLWEEKSEALKCIHFLSNNTVTPTTLIEIVDEFCFR